MRKSSRLAPERVTHELFLPGDDDSLDERSVATCRALAEALDVGLRKTNEAFWAHVKKNGPGLGRSLDSYLQFKTRPFESRGEGADASTSTADDALARKVFLTLLRLVNDGARERTSLSVEERRDVVLKYGLIDVPKIFDVAVLYGQDNKDLARELIESAVKLVPTLVDKFVETGAVIEGNLNDMVARVTSAAQTSELSPDGLRESLSYFHDVAISLLSLVAVYPSSGEWLRRVGNLVDALEMVRSNAIPTLETLTNDTDALDAVRDSVSAVIACLQDRQGEDQVSKYRGLSPPVIEIIESIRMILPDLGIGFVNACIDHFGPNTELIIQHLFEESLPPNLRSVDRQLGWPPVVMKSVQGSGPPRVSLGPSINKRDIDIELSAEDKKRILMVARDLEYEDEYDDSFDELPIHISSTAVDEMEGGEANGENTRRSNASKKVFYLIDGKVYHSHKAGAVKVFASSAEEASQMAAEAASIKEGEIEGLGAGGNRAKFATGFVPSKSAAPFVPRAAIESASKPETQGGVESTGGPGRGRGRGRGSGGRATRGLTAKDFTHKHHNQKAKAAKKTGI